MKKLAFVLCVACVSLVQGSGHLTDETREVPAYSSVSVASGFKGTIGIGAPSLLIHIDDNLHKFVKTSVSGTTLEVGVVDNVDITPSSDSVFTITNSKIDGIELSGGSTFVATLGSASSFTFGLSGGSSLVVHGAQSNDVSANLSGGSVLELEGQAKSLTGNLSGGSRLTSTVYFEDIVLELSGSSRVVVYASHGVHIVASGESDATVHGNPAVRDVVTSGSASIHFAD